MEMSFDVATITQLAGVDAVGLIAMIVRTADTARMHKKNCVQFAQHLKLIGNLLEQLKIPELKKYPETREPLEQLEDALRRSYVLVDSCHGKSYLYLLAMGWSIANQFKTAQNEIDRFLRLVPLITLVDNARVRQNLEDIEMDQREYTLEEEDIRMHDVILKPEPSMNGAMVLKKNLSYSYPNKSFEEALRKESNKLRLELHRSQANHDVDQCEVIHHLIDVTEGSTFLHHELGKNRQETNVSSTSRLTPSAPSAHELFPARDIKKEEEWNANLLGCLSEPSLCIRTFFYPCSTFSRIYSVANNRHMSSGKACIMLMIYSLVLSCSCYTCRVRRKLRQVLNIKGGWVDDFLSHLICCYCSLVQEWREVEIRGIYGHTKSKTSPPPLQHMEA